jgi:TPR repeat protein
MSRRLSAIGVLLLLAGLPATGCNTTPEKMAESKPAEGKPAKDAVVAALEAWTSTRQTDAGGDALFAPHVQNVLQQARAKKAAGFYCLAALIYGEGGDLKAAKATLDEASTLFPDLDGLHFEMAQLYFSLAFFDLLRRGELSVSRVPAAEVKPADLKGGCAVGDDIRELLSPGRPKVYRDAIAKAGFDEKSSASLGLYMSSLQRGLAPENLKELEKVLKDIGPPAYFPVVTWPPAARDSELLRLAYSEIEAARKAKPMPEPNPEQGRIVDRFGMDCLGERLKVLLKKGDAGPAREETPADAISDEDRQWLRQEHKEPTKENLERMARVLKEAGKAMKRRRAEDARKAAEEGNPVAQRELAGMYGDGDGVSKSESEALKWYTKAAEQGDVPAQCSLGLMYAKGEGGLPVDYAKSIVWLRKAAAKGDGRALYTLCLFFENGDGVDVDKDEALRLSRRAAGAGFPAAQTSLGMRYFRGDGVEQDSRQAFQWCLKAARQRDLAAIRVVGVMYMRGEGTEKDNVEALKWLMLLQTLSKSDDDRQGATLLKQQMSKAEIDEASKRLVEMVTGQRTSGGNAGSSTDSVETR